TIEEGGPAAEDVGAGELPWTPVMRAQGGQAALGEFAQWAVVGAPAGLGTDTLAAGLGAVLDTHDMLRARVAPGGRTLTVAGPGEPAAADLITRVDATRGRADRPGRTGPPYQTDALDRIADHAAREAVGRLDPAAGVLVQAVWVDAGPDRTGRLV
ncbi:hypothetical protein ADK38_37200, partial [Streptomyces varsoviensis]